MRLVGDIAFLELPVHHQVKGNQSTSPRDCVLVLANLLALERDSPLEAPKVCLANVELLQGSKVLVRRCRCLLVALPSERRVECGVVHLVPSLVRLDNHLRVLSRRARDRCCDRQTGNVLGAVPNLNVLELGRHKV